MYSQLNHYQEISKCLWKMYVPATIIDEQKSDVSNRHVFYYQGAYILEEKTNTKHP